MEASAYWGHKKAQLLSPPLAYIARLPSGSNWESKYRVLFFGVFDAHRMLSVVSASPLFVVLRLSDFGVECVHGF